MSKPSLLHHQEIAIGRMLAMGVLDGRWSIEDLDTPTQTSVAVEADRRTAISRAQRTGQGAPFPAPKPHRNLATEWINTHPEEWLAAIQRMEPVAFTPVPIAA